MSRKKEATAKQTTRQLIGIDEITDSGLKTSHGRLIFFAIKPTNLSVQPPEAVSNRIYALMTVLKGQAEIEMLALNSKESFEDNKRHYRQRAAEEDLPVISRLLEADAKSLDRLQIQMATAREFFVLVRLREENRDGAAHPPLPHPEKPRGSGLQGKPRQRRGSQAHAGRVF